MLSGKLIESVLDGSQAHAIRVVFVIMLVSSLAFYVMAFRVPVVRNYCKHWNMMVE